MSVRLMDTPKSNLLKLDPFIFTRLPIVPNAGLNEVIIGACENAKMEFIQNKKVRVFFISFFIVLVSLLITWEDWSLDLVLVGF